MSDPTRIERILQKLGIEYESRGDRLWALCPYHEDHKASWMIRYDGERAGQHHCFVCKKGGGLVDLVMHRRGYMNIGSAFEWLKDFEEAPPPPVKLVSFKVLSPVEKTFKLPRSVIFAPLKDWPTEARRYVEGRGIAFQVERWRIGYAIEGRLAGRIVLVVWSGTSWRPDSWVPASYQARTFVDHDSRYYFPFESDNPNLDVMFGQCFFPLFSKRRTGRVYVTEGAINALAVERVVHHDGHFVAALGSSDVREAHLGLLSTFGEVVIVTDNDKAGDHAADELYYALARHTKVARVKFPPKEDPASVSPEICRRIVTSAQPQ